MLLTVMDLVEAGEIGGEGWVVYDVRLVSRFRDYWDGEHIHQHAKSAGISSKSKWPKGLGYGFEP